MKKKINIVFFSANRAEYSLISPFLKIFSKSKYFKVGLVVGGSHLEKKFGFPEAVKDSEGKAVTFFKYGPKNNINTLPKHLKEKIEFELKIEMQELGYL